METKADKTISIEFTSDELKTMCFALRQYSFQMYFTADELINSRDDTCFRLCVKSRALKERIEEAQTQLALNSEDYEFLIW